MLKRISFIALLIIGSTSVFAQYDHSRKEQSQAGSREGRWEGSVILAYQTGLQQIYGGGSELDVDSTPGWGVSVAWNWTDHLSLSYRLLFTNPNYTATFVSEDPLEEPQVFNDRMTKLSNQFNLTYNFSRKAFTPFVVAGVGWTKLNSNVPDAPLTVNCGVFPFLGYRCVADWKTYNTSGFSYNLGAGVRWDVNDAIFTKATYSREFFDVDSGSINFDTAILELGLMF